MTDLTRLRAVLRSQDRERGATTLEAVILVPLVFLATFTIVQIGLFIHAGNVATGAAQAAYEEARLFGSDSYTGTNAGYNVIHESGNALSGATVTVNRGPEHITVTVTGQGPSLVPGMPIDIHRTVTGPTERWVD
ncbi:pilus assembly protein [Pseudoclavibacter alba]|uniref:TadE/TadG family type IV pilus assembly protein n=1 Tax=Pseudoclavibacter albus TaxID=272241 RepID=UPI0019D185FF|nr:TadE family protein [Pseudoclavibacter alba]MBN6778862.1 pilus assembly protein [Pseudoclavibacter alba]